VCGRKDGRKPLLVVKARTMAGPGRHRGEALADLFTSGLCGQRGMPELYGAQIDFRSLHRLFSQRCTGSWRQPRR
jgi:hypothetical protein